MNFIQQTCNQLAKPPKLKYSSMDLGYVVTTTSRRHDFQIFNTQKELLKCSFYVPKNPNPVQVCVVYLHSMNGSRLECLGYIDRVVKLGLYMASFDFSGCGNSEGTCISFGANQKHDVDAVLQAINQKFNVNRFLLWGRSMGAVAGIKYCEMISTTPSPDLQILGILLDSPFKSLKQLIIQLGTKRSQLPSILLHAFYLVIKPTLQKTGNFSIDQLQLQKSIKQISNIPICFLVSKDDTTIDPSHSQHLYSTYRYWDKRLIYFNGLHNQSRDQGYLGSVVGFLEEKMGREGRATGPATGGTGGRGFPYYRRVLIKQGIVGDGEGEGQGGCECRLWRG